MKKIGLSSAIISIIVPVLLGIAGCGSNKPFVESTAVSIDWNNLTAQEIIYAVNQAAGSTGATACSNGGTVTVTPVTEVPVSSSFDFDNCDSRFPGSENTPNIDTAASYIRITKSNPVISTVIDSTTTTYQTNANKPLTYYRIFQSVQDGNTVSVDDLTSNNPQTCDISLTATTTGGGTVTGTICGQSVSYVP